jgi:UDP-N-acetyl-D-mannosaminuronic acid dehydrogenase
MSIEKVCVLGLGYIGLPSAAIFADQGYYVVGVDINESVVDHINSANTKYAEPGLAKLVDQVVSSKHLKASLEPISADVYLIAVPTPFISDTYPPKPDMSYVFAALDAIGPYIQDDSLVILESTSPIGTTDAISDYFKSKNFSTENMTFAHCPERVLPGDILNELVNNDRIVGGIDSRSTEIASQFYRSILKNGIVHETDARTAELCKLSENSFRDVNIAFANELSMIADESGVDIFDLISLANKHPRVNILAPGAGVGGHCLAVDPWFIVESNPNSTKLIRASREINDFKPVWVVEKIKNFFKDINPNDVVISCFGLTYKPDVDDYRESPALNIAKNLIEEGFSVELVEPNLPSIEGFSICDRDSAIKKADLILPLVAHKEFLTEEFKNAIKGKRILDICGFYT